MCTAPKCPWALHSPLMSPISCRIVNSCGTTRRHRQEKTKANVMSNAYLIASLSISRHKRVKCKGKMEYPALSLLSVYHERQHGIRNWNEDMKRCSVSPTSSVDMKRYVLYLLHTQSTHITFLTQNEQGLSILHVLHPTRRRTSGG